jgi:hypothetical protein
MYMQSKWFQFTPWRSQHDANSNGSTNGAPVPAAKPETARSKPAGSKSNGNGYSMYGNELLPFEEIYLSAGIQTPRLGYSISKVVAMLSSEYIRDMPSETKRASLMMALDAAGVQVNEVLQDATLRQHALNSYETGQKKRLEQYESRKSQDNREIQAEMDRVTAQYLSRINSNLDEVAREKDALRKWQIQKQEEAHHMAEAVALCVKHQGTQPEDESVIALRELASSVDPYSKR